MGIRYPTPFSRSRRRRRTRLGSHSARRSKDFRRKKIFKDETREADSIIRQAKRNRISLNGQNSNAFLTEKQKHDEKRLPALEQKQEKTAPVLEILAWFGKIFLGRN